MTRPRHAHRQGQRRRSVALLILGIGVPVALLAAQTVAGHRPIVDATVATLLAHRDADREAPPGGRATQTPTPTAASLTATTSTDPTAIDPLGSGADVGVGLGRPDVAVPSPEVRVQIGPGPGATAVFLGDSYTSGWEGAGIGPRGWPRLVGSERGWKAVNLAVPGTGFLNPGWTGQPIASLVVKAANAQPDVIVLAGGHNNSRWSASATARAASDVIDRLRKEAPDALLVIVAPIWRDGSPPRRLFDLRDELEAKADDIDAVFVDPLADGWFAGTSHRLIGPDGIHPTDAGHRFIAEQMLAALGS